MTRPTFDDLAVSVRQKEWQQRNAKRNETHEPQSSLFDADELPPIVSVPNVGTIQERFEAFHTANPHVYERIVKLVFEMRDAGLDRYSTKAAFEVLRYESAMRTRSDSFKLPNEFTSRYGHKLVKEFPQLAGFIITKELKTQ